MDRIPFFEIDGILEFQGCCPNCLACFDDETDAVLICGPKTELAYDEEGYCICSRPGDAHVIECKVCGKFSAMTKVGQHETPRYVLCRSEADLTFLGLSARSEAYREKRRAG
jgi:hypothetical protein